MSFSSSTVPLYIFSPNYFVKLGLIFQLFYKSNNLEGESVLISLTLLLFHLHYWSQTYFLHKGFKLIIVVLSSDLIMQSLQTEPGMRCKVDTIRIKLPDCMISRRFSSSNYTFFNPRSTIQYKQKRRTFSWMSFSQFSWLANNNLWRSKTAGVFRLVSSLFWAR